MSNALLVAFIIAIIIMWLWLRLELQTIKVRSCNDSCKKFNVHMSYDDKKEAAKLLHEMTDRFDVLIEHMENKYECSRYTEECKKVQRLIRGYNENSIWEIHPRNLFGFTSYTENKGEQLVFCLRKPNGELHDINTMMFVGLHELSHIMNDEWGHKPKFWHIFRFVLDNAVECGIYQPVNYAQNPITYCGSVHINNSPLF
jgi:hypothetical protein